MGLDQYLNAQIYVSRHDYSQDHVVANPAFQALVEHLDITHYDKGGYSGIGVDVPMGYWRKCNQIHQWFVDNIQDGNDDCGQYYVGREAIAKLLQACKDVLADHSLAEELLPSQAGFFFGSTDYNEWYFADLKNTVEILKYCLESPYDYFQYSSSW